MVFDKLFTHDSRPCSHLRKPRFGTNSIIGQRLVQDLKLWSHLAKVSGLQKKAFSLSKVRTSRPFNESEIASSLYALLRQSWPWTVLSPRRSGGKIVVEPIIAFGEVIRGLGVNMTIEEYQVLPEVQSSSFSYPFELPSYPRNELDEIEAEDPGFEILSGLSRRL